jgi:hypothetical protein
VILRTDNNKSTDKAAREQRDLDESLPSPSYLKNPLAVKHQQPTGKQRKKVILFQRTRCKRTEKAKSVQ